MSLSGVKTQLWKDTLLTIILPNSQFNSGYLHSMTHSVIGYFGFNDAIMKGPYFQQNIEIVVMSNLTLCLIILIK